jgi:hypothetical protein
VAGGPSGLHGLSSPSLYLKIGEVKTSALIDEPVYLQCTGEQDDYTCTLCVTLGRATPRRPSGKAAGLADISAGELRAFLEKARAALDEVRALTTADFLTRRSGQFLQQAPLPDHDLLMWRADVSPFAEKHPSCQQAVDLVDNVIQVRLFRRYAVSDEVPQDYDDDQDYETQQTPKAQ